MADERVRMIYNLSETGILDFVKKQGLCTVWNPKFGLTSKEEAFA